MPKKHEPLLMAMHLGMTREQARRRKPAAEKLEDHLRTALVELSSAALVLACNDHSVAPPDCNANVVEAAADQVAALIEAAKRLTWPAGVSRG